MLVTIFLIHFLLLLATAPDTYDRVVVAASVGNCGVLLRQRSGRVIPVTRRPSNRDTSDPGGLLGWAWGGKKGAYWPAEASSEFLVEEPSDPDSVALFRLARNKKGNANYSNLHFAMLPCRVGDVLLLGTDGVLENLMRVVPPTPPANADPLAVITHEAAYAQKQAHVLEELLWAADRTPLLHALRAIAEHINQLSAPARHKEEEASRASAALTQQNNLSSGTLSPMSPNTRTTEASVISTSLTLLLTAGAVKPAAAEQHPCGWLDHAALVGLRIPYVRTADDEEMELSIRAHELYGEPSGIKQKASQIIRVKGVLLSCVKRV